VASVVSSIDDIAADFAQVALLAKDAGADIVEANYSCPNTPGDPAGEIYQSPEKAARISAAIREALGNTSFLTKIGYLAKPQLRRFLELNAKYIDGVVAINTVAAEVIQRPKKVGTAQKVVDYLKALNYLEKNPTFPGRPKAGVSGWAIKARAQEVARNLVDLRKEIPGRSGKPLAILGVGGVLTAQDFFERLAVGVDAVESCTGAFLNPYLGLEIRSYNRNVEQMDVESPAR
jgi:dihydroorotate dehydrogenase